MGARAAAPVAPEVRGQPLRPATHAECLAASGHDPFVRWQVSAAQGWVMDGAVAFQQHTTLTVVGPPDAAARPCGCWSGTHALNRNLVTGSDQAYPLYWSAPDASWSRRMQQFDEISASVRPRN